MRIQDLLRLFFCCVVVNMGQPAGAQQADLDRLLELNRYPLSVKDGEMSGLGAPFLRKEFSRAQFVAIGEEHGTREIPQFVWATCRAMAQDRLDALAIESGPLVTAQIQQWTATSGGSSVLAKFEKQYPDSIAFFNWQQEFDLLSHCQKATTPRILHLWGLDQEFLGSPMFILQQILETHPGVQAEVVAQKIQAQCAVDTQKGIATGSWQDACMLRLSPVDLANLLSAVERTKNQRAQDLTSALIKTQHIYSFHEGGHRYDANRERALLLKRNFLADYEQLAKATGRPPRVLLKFGGNHLFKGLNETDLNDLGNFLTEFADGLASSSLHIEVLGVRGNNEAESGPGQPERVVAKDAAPEALARVYAEAYPEGWTLFDLRPLRGAFASFGHVDRELERLIFGYDMLVLIPEVTAQTAIR